MKTLLWRNTNETITSWLARIKLSPTSPNDGECQNASGQKSLLLKRLRLLHFAQLVIKTASTLPWNSAERSNHIWTLKDNNIAHIISWNILASARPYNTANKRCNLCLREKVIIIRQPERFTLNKTNKLVSSCPQRNKALLRSNWHYLSHYLNSRVYTGVLLPSKSPDESV